MLKGEEGTYEMEADHLQRVVVSALNNPRLNEPLLLVQGDLVEDDEVRVLVCGLGKDALSERSLEGSERVGALGDEPEARGGVGVDCLGHQD